MRINIVTAGVLIVVVSALFLYSEIVASIFGFVLGSLNITIGILTRKSVGTTGPTDRLGPLRLSVDKGVIRTNIYILAFGEKKLVLRKLSSAKLTVVTALILAVLGAALAGPFGVVVGGVTAFSLQEYLTQRRREEVMKGSLLEPSGRGDLEFFYDELDAVRLLGNRIQLNLKNRIVRIAVSRKSSRSIGPLLEKIISSKFESGPILSERAL